MVAKIFAKFGPLKGSDFELEDDMVVGRAKSSQIVLAHKLVSNRHARIFRNEAHDCYMLEDLGSLNGTILDGEAIQKPERLGHLHILNFGGSSDFFFIDSSQVPRDMMVTLTSSKPQPVEPILAAKEEMDTKSKTFFGKIFAQTPANLASKSESQIRKPLNPEDEKNATMYGEKIARVPNALLAKLRGPNGGGQGEKPAKLQKFSLLIANVKGGPKVYNLEEGENLIGRGEGIPIRIVHSEISRHHAMIIVSQNRVYIRDMGSTNHTFVGNKMIEGEMEIKPGTKLAFGKIKGKLDIRKS